MSNAALEVQNIQAQGAAIAAATREMLEQLESREDEGFQTRPEMCACDWYELGECRECADSDALETKGDFMGECEDDERRFA